LNAPLWSWDRWAIGRSTNGAGKPCLVVYGAATQRRGGFTDYPIRWPNGTIAYDWPERIPARVKAAVARLMPTLGATT